MTRSTRSPQATTASAGRRRALASGYLALDAVLYNDRATLRAGGTAGNVASNLAFFGWQAGVFGRVSSDPLGAALHQDLLHAGVGTRHLEASETASTPVVLHHVSAKGPKYSFRCPSCGRKLGRHSPPKPDAAERVIADSQLPDVLFFDRVSKGTIQLAEAARANGRLVVFEPSTLGVKRYFESAIRLAHIVKYSSERATAVESALPRRPAGQIRIVTRGPQGLEVSSSARGWRSLPAFDAHVVDEAGAGDWATAAFLSALPTLKPKELDEQIVSTALRLAQAVAAMSCSFVGARGMALAWTRRRVLENAGRIVAENSQRRPRENVAGEWFARHELAARLCAPLCPAAPRA